MAYDESNAHVIDDVTCPLQLRADSVMRAWRRLRPTRAFLEKVHDTFYRLDYYMSVTDGQTEMVQHIPCFAIASSKCTRNTLDCNQSNYSSRIVFSHTLIEFGPTRNSAIRMDGRRGDVAI